MNKAERDRVLARKSQRQEALLKRVKPKHRRAATTSSGGAGSAADTTSSPPTATRDGFSPPQLSSIVAQYVDEYTAAQTEIARQRNRLVVLRGGEDHLIEEDHEALENIRDIVSARYERLLEV